MQKMIKKKWIDNYNSSTSSTSVIKHTSIAVNHHSSLEHFTSTREQTINNKYKREPVEYHNAPDNVPESKGDLYEEELRKETAQIIAGPEIKAKELKILTPPPENSYPYTDGYSLPCPYTDESEESQSSHSTSEPKKPSREGKDEKLAREKGITNFISTYDIINLPMDEFNDKLQQCRLPEHGMTEEQIVCARDIRRRGKNKNAAQNCRKRANSRIDKLREDVKTFQEKKRRLSLNEEYLNEELRRTSDQLSELNQRIYEDLEFDPKIFTLENDYTTGKVRFNLIKRTEYDQVFTRDSQQLPRPLPVLHRPFPQVVLEKVPNLHRRPYPNPTHYPPYHPYPTQPAVSLFPVMPQSEVSLYPVPYIPVHHPPSLHHESDRFYSRNIERQRVQSGTVVKDEPEDLIHGDH